jgi:Zn-dependent membrane protease YugP
MNDYRKRGENYDARNVLHELLVADYPGVLLGLWAQIKLSSTYDTYSRSATRAVLTGARRARGLDSAGTLQYAGQ